MKLTMDEELSSMFSGNYIPQVPALLQQYIPESAQIVPPHITKLQASKQAAHAAHQNGMMMNNPMDDVSINRDAQFNYGGNNMGGYPHQSAQNPGNSLRKGKWTVEEEEFTSKIIHYFNTGILQLPEGTTLRSYLAEKLNCDPMRITKKFTGSQCLGKRVYHQGDVVQATHAQVVQALDELSHLERRFKLRLEREKQKTRSDLDAETTVLHCGNVVSTPAIDAMVLESRGIDDWHRAPCHPDLPFDQLPYHAFLFNPQRLYQPPHPYHHHAPAHHLHHGLGGGPPPPPLPPHLQGHHHHPGHPGHAQYLPPPHGQYPGGGGGGGGGGGYGAPPPPPLGPGGAHQPPGGFPQHPPAQAHGGGGGGGGGGGYPGESYAAAAAAAHHRQQQLAGGHHGGGGGGGGGGGYPGGGEAGRGAPFQYHQGGQGQGPYGDHKAQPHKGQGHGRVSSEEDAGGLLMGFFNHMRKSNSQNDLVQFAVEMSEAADRRKLPPGGGMALPQQAGGGGGGVV